MITNLHLSHTDIRSDSRILKEMASISKDSRILAKAIGVIDSDERCVATESKNFEIHIIDLFAKKVTFFPAAFRHVMSFLELSLRILLIAIKIRPQIIHSHDVVVLPAAVLLKIIFGAKIVYDAHELESDRNGITRAVKITTLFFERLFWKKIDFFITVSSSILHWYREKYGFKEAVVVLNSPVTPLKDFFNRGEKQTNYLRKKFNIPENNLIFIYVGALGLGRGIELFLDIFPKTKGADLVFLGYGELALSIKAASNSCKNIHFHEAVKHDRVVEIIKSADVGLCLIENVSLSDYYCLPNKLFEYCLANVPIIASDFPEIAKAVNHFNLGVCCSDNLESVSKAIKAFIDRKVAVHIAPSAVKEFGWEAQEEKLLKVYASTVERLAISRTRR